MKRTFTTNRVASGRHSGHGIGLSLRWLTIIAVFLLLLVFGLRAFFSNLEDELRARGENERARLFVGEEIMLGIQGVERNLYLMAATQNRIGFERVNRQIEIQLDKLYHDLEVLRFGGTAYRQMPLNLSTQEEGSREASYRPDPKSESLVMELIEIEPQLGLVRERVKELQDLLQQRWETLQADDRQRFYAVENDIALLVKQLPPYFNRLDENANRLFLEGDRRLRELEGQVQERRSRLKELETILIVLVLVTGGTGAILYMLRLSSALGEVRLAKDEIERQREQVATMLDTLSDGVYATDLSGNVTFINRAAELLLDQRSVDLVGRNAHAAMHHTRYDGSPFPAAECPLLEVLNAGISLEGESDFVRRDGRLFPVAFRSKPLLDSGRIVGALVSFQDITQRREVEKALRNAHDQALEHARLKSEFLSNMSHEIRTPMNGIIGMADLLLDTSLNGEQREFAGIVRDSAQSLLRIINDILDFSKIESGKLDIEHIDYSPLQIVEGVIELMAHKAQDKHLKLESRIDPSLPQRVCGDPTRLRQVLLNLVGNAIKFTQQGMVEIAVFPDFSGATPMLRFEIRDSGIGLSAAAQSRLFRSFSQADSSTTRKYGGTGLGLAISKQLVELMGGTIGVDSDEGRGSIFWFALPHVVATSGAFEPVAPRGDGSCEPPSPPGRRKILLAEDNATNRMVAIRFLEKLGYTADVVDNGAAAAAAADASRYGLILMDCQMPEMDGFEATAAIRRAEQGGNTHIPIIAMTANAMQGDRERCLAAGMDDYISKPIDSVRLAEVLSTWSDAVVNHPPDQSGVTTQCRLVNFTHLQELGDDPAVLREIYDTFCATTPELLDRLLVAATARDAAAAKPLAHDIKGACGNLGIERMAEIARTLEEALLVADWSHVDTLLADLGAAYSETAGLIREHFNL